MFCADFCIIFGYVLVVQSGLNTKHKIKKLKNN